MELLRAVLHYFFKYTALNVYLAVNKRNFEPLLYQLLFLFPVAMIFNWATNTLSISINLNPLFLLLGVVWVTHVSGIISWVMLRLVAHIKQKVWEGID